MVNVHQYWVYILSNKSHSVLYIGITNDLYRRYLEHKDGIVEGFTKKYRCHSLLYYEDFKDAYAKADFYLKNDTLRKQIARNGYEKIKNNFTYEERFAFMKSCCPFMQ